MLRKLIAGLCLFALLGALFAVAQINPADAACKGTQRVLCLGTIANNPTVNGIAEGDSITIGLGGTPAYPFAALSLMPGGLPGTPGTNTPTNSPVKGTKVFNLLDIATSGISTLTLDQNYATRAGAQFKAGQLNVLTYMAGTNGSGANDANYGQRYCFIRDYLRLARNTGYQRVVVGTTIARDDDGGTQWTTILVPLNTQIRTYYNSDMQADALSDFGASPLFSPASAALNLTYYTADMLHPNATGEAAMGAILEPAEYPVLSAAGARSVAPRTWSQFSVNAGGNGGYDGTTTLSGDFRTAGVPTGSAQYGIRGFPGAHSGKFYWETNIVTSATSVTTGIVDDYFKFNNIAIGQDAGSDSIGYNSFDGTVKIANVTLATLASIQTGDVISVAADFSTKLVWFRRCRTGVCQNWNANGSADPATGIGGISFAAMQINGAGDRFYPAGGVFTGADSIQSLFAASQLTQTAPAGYSSGFGP